MNRGSRGAANTKQSERRHSSCILAMPRTVIAERASSSMLIWNSFISVGVLPDAANFAAATLMAASALRPCRVSMTKCLI